ncbi:MAG: hypothetical protein GX452_02115 [Ignavibacteriales bacterium]|jgi:hypothetical protein|nr:hypothetical protein [Ignavibacteriaceae bacterium]NLH60183.1 hypothetical protein [Ignavibacteriales bacterium]HOJ17301.1 hypothetical protein [Ignavibacteriaceae bacterium]HPO54881.1 hypothetical protein [Ignavibacteriaceae bacterium]
MIKLFVFLGLLQLSLLAQTSPLIFKLQNEEAGNYPVSENPASNSLNDILIKGDTIWLASSRGLSRSFDGGDSWTNYYQTDAFGTESVTSIGFYRGIIFASTAHSVEVTGQTLPEGSGIRFSLDYGETWKSVPQSVDDSGDSSLIYGINTLRALPVTTTVQNITYDLTFHKNHLYIATFAGGLRRINVDSLIQNQNAKWERVVLPPDYLSSIKPVDTLKFSLQPVAGKFGPENYLNHRVFSVEEGNDSLLLVGSANGINKSTDGGISWSKFNHQNQLYPVSGNFVVALNYSNETGIIWGATWKAEDQNEAYGISFSSDGGASWSTALQGEKVHNISTYNDLVIATSSTGAFLGKKDGLSWILTGPIVDFETQLSLKTTHFYSSAFSDIKDEIWLGSVDGLVRHFSKSSIWGNKWKIYFASNPLMSKSETYSFPNPFSPKAEQVKIKYSTGGKNVKVTIRIFDFGMNLVRTLIQNADRSNPLHRVNVTNADDINGVIEYWDGRDDANSIVPNGVYFYRIDVGDDDPLFGKIMVLQ